MLYHLLLVSSTVLPLGRTLAASPCATVSARSASFMSAYPSATAALVPAAIAEDCLRSVPINKEEDLALIDEYKLYLDWQTNLAWHKNPPEGFTDGKTDVIGNLDTIKQNLVDDKYTSEFTLMADIQDTVVKAHDFHFQLRPWIRNIMSWKRGNGIADTFAMTSVSKDGKEVPKLYDYHDIMKSNGTDWSPSPILKINNQTAEKYAENFAEIYEFHDGDARYNNLFPNQATRSFTAEVSDYVPFGRNGSPDGAYTTIEHENGTVRQITNYAVVFTNFNGVSSTNDLTGLLNGTWVRPTSSKRDATKVRRAVATPTGYPAPVIWNTLGVIGGYYLSGQGYEDVAVLSVPTFDAGDAYVSFQNLIGTFLQEAHEAGKTKLVIDIRANGGGSINLGYDLFQQLFPSMYPYGASTLHANEALNLAGKAMTKLLANITYETAVNASTTGDLAYAYGSYLNYKVPLTVDGENFKSWEEYFGPTLHDGSNTTTPQRRNMTNWFADLAPGYGGDITGYGNRTNKLNHTQFFKADDMVLLSDGNCGSTCALFAELMKTQGRVKQVAIGGLPKLGPMQAVGGTKGVQVYSFNEIHKMLSFTAANVAEVDQAEFNQTAVGALVNATRPLHRDMNRGDSSRINFRDNIRINDTSVTPLEFVYEAADCRLFYTAEMIRNVTAVWQKTVDAHWGDANKTCVEGSVADKSSLSGGGDDTTQSTATTTSGNPKPTGSKTSAAAQIRTSSAVILFVVGLVGILIAV